MLGMRDFLAEVFEMIGQSLLRKIPVQHPATPPAMPPATLPGMPMQMQDNCNQPPHARGLDPSDNNIGPWLFLPATMCNDAAAPAAVVAAANPHVDQHSPPTPPPPLEPKQPICPVTLQAALRQLSLHVGDNTVYHKHEWT